MWRGSCPPTVCVEGEIQSLDVKSCECEPLKAPVGELVDLSKNARFDFTFDLGQKITFREWALTTGGYEWSLPEMSEFKCLSEAVEGFDDGRYRQRSYEASTDDCKDTIVRVQLAVPDG